MMLIPPKLKTGDEIRVISPARSLALISEETRENARRRFAELGLSVSYSKHAEEEDQFGSSSVASRVSDIHDVIADENVKAVFTTIERTVIRNGKRRFQSRMQLISPIAARAATK